MDLNIILSENLKKTIPDSILIDNNFGEIKITFPPTTTDDDIIVKIGDNVIINEEKEDILKWLKPYKTIAVNKTDKPQSKEFNLMKVKNIFKM